ncbi:MAG: thiamine pyrophosphate-binding protein [Magnetococcales bacterium]|nr:thiamine pyrophosphate-binding protein [Magnetococcales bacterium]
MTTPVRVADYIFSFVARLGVEVVFMVPGGGAMYLVDALGQNPDLKAVANLHEQASAIAAEAYGRVKGCIGVALVTTGPGATNAITGVAGAWIESIPLLVISGQVKRADLMGSSGVRQMGPQEVDIVSMVRPIVKYAVTVMDPRMIRFHLEKAVDLATSGRHGPVWLDVPLDVQASLIDPETLPGLEEPTAAIGLTGNALEEAARTTLQLLANAQRPLLLAGHGVRLAEGAELFRQLYERLRIPVAATWNAMDLIPHDHPLCVGRPGVVALRGGNFAVQNCDLLISIGARLDNVVTAFNPTGFARAAQRVVVDIDANELAKHPMELAQSIQADAREYIAALLRLTEGQEVLPGAGRAAWLDRCADWKRRYPIADGKPFPDSGAISHYHLVKILSEEIPEGSLIVTGSSGLGVEVFYTGFNNRPGQRIFLTSGLGAMGYGIPALLGGGAAWQGTMIVGIESDGSLQMNIQELQTLVAMNLPVHLFIINNSGYASIRNTQRNYFQGRYVGVGPGSGLHLADPAQVAQAMGIPSMVIADAAELRSGIREALSRPGPVLCDVRVVHDEALWPKTAAIPQPDGSLISMPLEDMSPLLSRDELRANMLIPLAPASEKV